MSNLNDLKTLIRFGQVLSLIDAQLLKHSTTMLDAMGPSILLECTDRRPRTDMAILVHLEGRNPCMRRLHALQTFPWLGQSLQIVDRQLLKHSNTMLEAMGSSIAHSTAKICGATK